MSVVRQVERNALKFMQKNNKIQENWKRNQIGKYGIIRYLEIRRKNKKKK